MKRLISESIWSLGNRGLRDFLGEILLCNKIFFVTLRRNILIIMKIKEQYKVREMAGEHVIIMQGKHGSDLTKIISLNQSALYLWNELQGKEFDTEMVADMLVEHYGIEKSVATTDAERWIEKLRECNIAE